MRTEDDLLRKLELWVAAQPRPPSLADVLATGDGELFGAYVVAAFRVAAAQAVEEHERIVRVRAAVLAAFGTDEQAAEQFLRRRHPLLGGKTPLERALSSENDADEVIKLARLDIGGAARRAFSGIAAAWALAEDEQAALLGFASRAELEAFLTANLVESAHISADALKRISLLLGIFRGINELIPDPDSADAWIRKPNAAPVCGGRSALEIMTDGGLQGLRRIRDYLVSERRL